MSEAALPAETAAKKIAVKPQWRDGRAADFVWAVFLVLVALAARLYQLGGKPLWLDEVLTQQRSSLALPGLIESSLRNHHSPLFFFVEHVIAATGSGAVALRLLPALAGALSAGLAFAVGRTAGLGAGAVLGGLLVALAPLQVAFGQEARSYTMMLAFVLVALWGLVDLGASAPGRPNESRRRRGAWLAYGLGTAGALLTLGDALLWVIASNIAMLVAIPPQVASRRRFLWRWCIVQCAIAVLVTPLYVAMATAHKGGVFDSFAWVPPLSGAYVWLNAATLYGLRDATMVSLELLRGPIPFLTPIMIALAAVGLVALRRARAPRAILLVAAVAPLLMLLLISFLHPILVPRYLLWSAVPFFLIVGAAIEILPGAVQMAALIVAAYVLAANLMPFYRAETKPRWDLAADFLALRLRPGDVVLTTDRFAALMLRTYLGAGAPPIVTPHTAGELPDTGRIWAVYGRAGQGRLPPPSGFFSKAESLGVPRSRTAIGREIAIERIDPPGTTVEGNRL